MTEDKHTARWRAVGKSVRGATHGRNGMPNQDAIHWLPVSGTGSPLIMAVADGHGSRRSFRSQVGARLAVETAVQVVEDFLRVQTQTESLSATKRAAEEWLPVALVRNWLGAVAAHLGEQPLSADELQLLGADEAKPSVDALRPGAHLAYGTTILAAAATRDFILYLQLGDGEILTVSSDGEVTSPLPKDQRLFANETTSLCSPDAWRDFRVCFQVISNAPPSLILLTTDGYPNSFRDESGFLKVGSDILDMVRSDGLHMVDDQLEAWLTESTYAGSGDDVTLGLIYLEDVTESETAPSDESAKKRRASGARIDEREAPPQPVEYEV
ncbi:MAG TPA: PP2C family serine/threonine-protein phosphatase [Pyrinomonadaceae bacterium]|nr:PP2C family serine/threonine-protein phosphatase [Pyrinomonadaceae bacterium]